jgi:hypothetical protein
VDRLFSPHLAVQNLDGYFLETAAVELLIKALKPQLRALVGELLNFSQQPILRCELDLNGLQKFAVDLRAATQACHALY